MRLLRWLAMLILVYSCTHGDSFNKMQQLQSLLDQKEYFKLRTSLNLLGDDISKERKIYFRAFVENAFNRNKQSEEDIIDLLSNYASVLTDSDKVALLRLQSNNYFRTFDYARAYASDQEIVGKYSHLLDSPTIKDIQNDILTRKALMNTPPQQLTKTEVTSLAWTRDKIGLIEIPITSHGSLFQGIFDTRANISSISRTYARKLGLRMLDVTYEEGSGITGIKFNTGMGIADSLFIGNILVRNVIFQVMPDEILYLAPVQFSLNIILGFPVIEQLEEVQIFRDGRIIIPLNPSSSSLNNLVIDGLDPVISIRTENDDTLGFYFDSGATSTELFSTFYRKYRAKIQREAKSDSAENGGAGGVVKTKVYDLDSLNMYIGDQKMTLKKVAVLIDPIGNMSEKFYGNIGQDFISQSKELILNFRNMYIESK
jgi:hypothetical protein